MEGWSFPFGSSWGLGIRVFIYKEKDSRVLGRFWVWGIWGFRVFRVFKVFRVFRVFGVLGFL